MFFEIGLDRPTAHELMGLYGSCGWTAYTRDPEGLLAAIQGSALVLTARGSHGELFGLARTISDGQTITYLQDILVRPDAQRQGIGGALLDEALQRSEGIRQFVLLTDPDPAAGAFYASRNLVEAHDVGPDGLRAYLRLR